LPAGTAALHVDEVAAVAAGDVRCACEPDERFCALFHCPRRRPQQGHGEAHQQAVVLIETAGYEARVKTAAGRARALEASRQLSREQDVGELALPVSEKAAVEVLGGGVLEWDIGTVMGFRSGGNDAERRAFLQSIEQERGQEEWRQMIDGPGQLDAIAGQLSGSIHGAGIVDENVNPSMPG